MIPDTGYIGETEPKVACLPIWSPLRLLPVRIRVRLHDASRAVRLAGYMRRKEAAPIALVATHELSLTGAPRVALDVVRVLCNSGYRVIVLSQSDGPMRADFIRLGALVLIDLLPGRNRSYLKRLAEHAEIAIVNTAFSAPFVSAWSSYVPTCWYLHEASILEEHAALGILSEPFSRAARVWAASEFCASFVKPYRQDVAVVVPHGLRLADEPQHAVSHKKAATPLRIAVIGSIESRKGQDLALEALAQLDPVERGQIHLHVYGRQSDTTFFHDVRQRCKIISEASFGGELDTAAYRAVLTTVDCILVSSREDALSLVSIDALSAGRMLLLTRAVGVSAWLRDDVDALIEEHADIPDMVRLLRRALLARSRAASIGAAAQANFEANFSPAAFATRLHAEFALIKSGWTAKG